MLFLRITAINCPLNEIRTFLILPHPSGIRVVFTQLVPLLTVLYTAPESATAIIVEPPPAIDTLIQFSLDGTFWIFQLAP